MQIPINVDHDATEPLQQQVFNAIRGLIIEQRLPAGTAMPSSRDLSDQLSVSRNTVLLAYEKLIAEGYLWTRPAVGTFVAKELPDNFLHDNDFRDTCECQAGPETTRTSRRPSPGPIRTQRIVNPNHNRLDVDFWVGRPDPHTFPIKAWRQHIVEHLSTAGRLLTEYGDPRGLPTLRGAIAERLGPARGVGPEADHILVVSGIQQALNLVARLLVRDGTPVVVECPCYQGAAYTLEHYGARLSVVPVDRSGLDTTLLSGIDAKLAYVTPSHQYPMGATLPLERRMRLLQWANERGAYIIEDDYDSDFRYTDSPLPALAGLDRGDAVIYLGTFSKSLGAGLRLGYMVLPGDLVEPAQALKTLFDNGSSWLDQAALADFIASEGYDRHLRRIRSLYRGRRDRLVEALWNAFGPVDLQGMEGGMHLVWRLPDELPSASQTQALALEEGVGVYALDGGAATDFDQLANRDRILLLGYSSLTEEQIEEGVRRLARRLA